MKPPFLGKRVFWDHPASDSSSSEMYREAAASDLEVTPFYTGRHLLILRNGKREVVKTTRLLETKWGLTVANTADFITETMCESRIKDADVLFYNELGIALVAVDDDSMELLHPVDADYTVEPEKVVYIPDDVTIDTAVESSWGIKAVRVHESVYTGEGVKLAVLDTGFDVRHPDFKGRNLTTFSFVPDETAEDLHGHGTHCIGIACGSSDQQGVRYGVAPGVQIYAGKVLNNGCRVLSMSLGSKVLPGQSYDIAYERAARFALSKGTLIVAAAGNDSRRSTNLFSPVSSPADCPSILAVGAVDSALQVADFSNRAINQEGLVDLAAPGVAIYSSWPMPSWYRTLSGTSMATPHVAGIAALLCKKFPDAAPAEIGRELLRSAGSLPLPTEDVGAGISLAP